MGIERSVQVVEAVALDSDTPLIVDFEANVGDVLSRMRSDRSGCAMVTRDEKLVGIFTERDLLRIVQEEADTSSIPVGQAMTAQPDVLRPDNRIALALNKMSEGGFRHIPLVDGRGRPVGIVAMRDIVRFIVSMFPDAVLTVPPDPAKIPTKYGG